jgi:2'-5' RNA ligase
MTLYHAVSDTLEAEGLAPEDRTYRPHVTLARLDDRPESVHAFLQENDDLSLPSFTSEALHLYESTLTPDGAVHERRASVALRRQAGSPS